MCENRLMEDFMEADGHYECQIQPALTKGWTKDCLPESHANLLEPRRTINEASKGEAV